MELQIIGNGVFGKFLATLLAPYASIQQEADNIILAIPLEAYGQEASTHIGKHLINVCSVQYESNIICSRYTKNVTGIHPLFGPQSSKLKKKAVLTNTCSKTSLIIELFKKVEIEIISELPDGQIIDGELHDKIMAVTHLAGLQVAEELKRIVSNASWVPENLIPPSFQKIRDFVEQCQDFSLGTISSIKANPFASMNAR